MRDKEFLDLANAYQLICEQQVGVPIPKGKTAEDVLKGLLPEKERKNVISPKMVRAAEEVDIFDDIVEFCEGIQIFDSISESKYFASVVIQEDLTQIFIEDALQYCGQLNLLNEDYITEISAGLLKRGLQIAGGVLKKAVPEVRGLSAKTLTKKGIRSTGLSSKGGRLSGDPRSDDIARVQAARAARKPPEPRKANYYVDQLAQKKAGLKPQKLSTPQQPSKTLTQKGWERHTAAGGPPIKDIQQRAVTDTALATMLMAFPHMLQNVAKPIAKNVASSSAIVRSARSGLASAPTATKKGFNYIRQAFTGSSNKRLAEPAGALVPTRGSKPQFKPEALPKSPKTIEPAGALVPTRGSKPQFKPEALPKSPKTIEPPTPPKTSSQKLLPPGKSGETLSPEGQAIRNLNKLTGGGPLGVTRVKTRAELGAAPEPAWGKGSTSMPKSPVEPGGAFAAQVATRSPKPSSRSSTKSPVSPTGSGKSNEDSYTQIAQGYKNRAQKRRAERSRKNLERLATGATVGGIAATAAGGVGLTQDKKREPSNINVYNTVDQPSIAKPTGQIRSRLAVGPRKIGSTFDDAFREAKRKEKEALRIGDKPKTTFTYGGKEYTTKMAEEYLIGYLLDEGFASDEKSAQAIASVMSEEWIQSIVESETEV